MWNLTTPGAASISAIAFAVTGVAAALGTRSAIISRSLRWHPVWIGACVGPAVALPLYFAVFLIIAALGIIGVFVVDPIAVVFLLVSAVFYSPYAVVFGVTVGVAVGIRARR